MYISNIYSLIFIYFTNAVIFPEIYERRKCITSDIGN